eukprot:TRINITY_DN387_c0_g1_i2.p2 TRINITY_DN387_c0_g1~~TRINITY_DN387_c0_g1_i2.p2  ORF type:complete len:150 (+),score=12.18 TRINITY_DN387_c0_g1_i2:753-1202(+)
MPLSRGQTICCHVGEEDGHTNHHATTTWKDDGDRALSRLPRGRTIRYDTTQEDGRNSIMRLHTASLSCHVDHGIQAHSSCRRRNQAQTSTLLPRGRKKQPRGRRPTATKADCCHVEYPQKSSAWQTVGEGIIGPKSMLLPTEWKKDVTT